MSVEGEAKRARDGILRAERLTGGKLARRYGAAYRQVKGDIDALLKAMAEMAEPSVAQVERLSLYRALMKSLEREIRGFGDEAAGLIDAGAESAIRAGLRDSSLLARLALPGLEDDEFAAAWAAVRAEQVATMAGFLAQGSPLYVNLQNLGADVAAVVADKLREAIIFGYNPRKTARLIRDATGMGLTWSLRTARTAQLWAYRLASHSNYLANSHVVRGWVWFAQLGDPRTCLSCTMQHGTEHGLEEVLNDHHNGRCSPLPRTVSYRDLGFNVPETPQTFQLGEDWFRGLGAEAQRGMMGEAMWTAWKKNEFALGDLSRTYNDPVYGEMLREASLRELLGERAKRYYRR